MNKTKKILIVTLIGFLSASIGWFANSTYAKMQESNAKNVARQFTSNVISNKASVAYESMSDEFRSSVSKKDFESLFSDSSSNTAAIASEAVGRTKKTIIVSYSITGLPKDSNGNTTGVMAVTLERIDGKWQIVNAILE